MSGGSGFHQISEEDIGYFKAIRVYGNSGLACLNARAVMFGGKLESVCLSKDVQIDGNKCYFQFS